MGAARQLSAAAAFASLPIEQQAAELAAMSDEDKLALNWSWEFWARPSQHIPPGAWKYWIINAGRGAGKTRSGAEWVRYKVSNGCGRVSLIAPTAADARDVMVEGESGILAVCWKGDKAGKPLYEPSKRRITWENGAQAALFSAEESERLRGPQSDAIWADELAAWGGTKSRALQEKTRRAVWDMAMFGLRLGDHPQALVTTTPKPSALLRELLADPESVVSSGSTYDNADNLAPSFLAEMRKKYEGTRLGRQELHAVMLDDVQGALWTAETIGAPVDSVPPLKRVVVGVDPSGADGSGEGDSDDIGIVVAAETESGEFIVLEDATLNASPSGWAKEVKRASEKHGADKVVVETNFGGALAMSNIRTAWPDAPLKKVVASRGKHIRAEPIASLYEQGRVKHVRGLGKLESQMEKMTLSGYSGDGSPDRLDALVWALTELSSTPAYVWFVDGKAVE